MVFDEIKVLKQLIKNHLSKDFANSFIVEINMDNIFDEAKFISFNNNRKEKYLLLTIIYDDKVEKRIVNSLGQNHILCIKKNIEKLTELNFDIIDNEKNGKIFSKYIEAESLYKILVNLFKEGNNELALEIITK